MQAKNSKILRRWNLDDGWLIDTPNGETLNWLGWKKQATNSVYIPSGFMALAQING